MTDEQQIDAAPSGPIVLTVPASSFDLLEGTAETRDQTRILNYVLVIMAVIAVTTFGSRILLTWLETINTNDEIQELTNRAAQSTKSLDDFRAAGVVSPAAVDDFIEKRKAMVAQIVGTETDYARILQQTNDVVTANGGTVESMTFIKPGESLTPNAPPTTAPLISEGPAGPAAATAPTLALSGTAPSLQQADQIVRSLSNTEALPFFSGDSKPGKVQCSESSNSSVGFSCTWDWSAPLSDAAKVDRTEQFANVLKSGS